MKRKVKKIPKYYNGELRVTPEQVLGPNPKLPSPGPLKWSKGKLSADAAVQGIQAIGTFADNVARSREEGVSFGSVLGGIGSGASTGAALGSVIPGIGTAVGAVAGGVIGGITSSIGRSGSVDETTGEVTESDGLTRLFGWGRSDRSLYAKADRIKTSINNKEITEDLKMQYANDVANSFNQNVFATAAEGGIMRRPVEALVSKGELIYNPVTKKLSQVPGSKGKPNKADDVYTRLYEGDMVVSNSPTMIMPNGKTPAQNLMGMVDKYSTGGTVKAREAIIKKVVNWQEANKTKPQEYAMFNGGGIARNKAYNKNIKHSRDYAKTSFYDAGNAANYALASEDIINWLNANPEELEKAKVALSDLPQMKKHLQNGKSFMEALKLNLSDGIYGQVHDYFTYEPSVSNNKIARINNIDNLMPTYNKPMFGNNYNFVDDLSSRALASPSTAPTSESVSLASVYGTGNNNKNNNNKNNNNKKNNTNNNTKSSFDWTKWGDLAYAGMSVLTPLFDIEKPDPVNYRWLNSTYRPVGIGVNSQFNDIDNTFATAMYNQSKINPNTGAGMTYGLTAASNRAQQRAAVRQWQANAQNELIGKNVDTYNRTSEINTNIMNNVYDKADANRAAARNINRQNRTQAFENTGRILRDFKIFDLYNKTFNS